MSKLMIGIIGLYLIMSNISISIPIPITKASKVSTQIFDLVRWFGPPMLLTGGL